MLRKAAVAGSSALCVLALLAYSPARNVNPSVEALAPCAEAATWVAENRERLPKSLDSFAAQSVERRRAIYTVLSADEQASLWREHFTAVLSDSAGLSRAQRELIRELALKVDRYVGDPETALQNVIADSVPQRVGRLMNPQLSTRIFKMIGSVEVSDSTAVRNGMKGAARSCSCSYSDDWCFVSNSFCTLGGGGCEPTLSGCGWFLCKACTGVCEWALPQY